MTTTTAAFTPETATRLNRAAHEQYRAANETIALTALYLLAAQIREEQPEAASFRCDWSDQGPWLILWSITLADGEEDDDVYDTNGQASSLDEDNQDTWEAYATASGDGFKFTFDVADVLAATASALTVAERTGRE